MPTGSAGRWASAAVPAFIAVLMVALALVVLFVPFEILAKGPKLGVLVSTLAGSIGELGTRLVFAVPMLLLAYAAWRECQAGGKDEAGGGQVSGK